MSNYNDNDESSYGSTNPVGGRGSGVTMPNEYGTSDSSNTAYGAQTGDYGKSGSKSATQSGLQGRTGDSGDSYGSSADPYGSNTVTQSGLQGRTGDSGDSYGSSADTYGSNTVTQSGLQQENSGATGYGADLGTTAGGYGTASKYDKPTDQSYGEATRSSEYGTSDSSNTAYGAQTGDYGKSGSTTDTFTANSMDHSYGNKQDLGADQSYGDNGQKPSTKDKIMQGAHKVIDKIVHPHAGSTDREDGRY